MAIVVSDYDPRWPDMFEDICRGLEAALDAVPVLAIEHVGSTSVPGLAAKPIIDVDIVVDRDLVAPARAALERAGYVYLGELGVPDRHAFRAPAGAIRQNTYVAVAGCLSLRNHLGVRDVLRRDADLRREYGEVKKRLAGEVEDIDVYIERKSEVLQRILAAAGLSDDERAVIEAINRA